MCYVIKGTGILTFYVLPPITLHFEVELTGNAYPLEIRRDHLQCILRKLDHAIYRFFSHVKKMKIFSRKLLIFFLFFAQNIDCGYTLEPPRQGGSNEYQQSMFWSTNKKK